MSLKNEIKQARSSDYLELKTFLEGMLSQKSFFFILRAEDEQIECLRATLLKSEKGAEAFSS